MAGAAIAFGRIAKATFVQRTGSPRVGCRLAAVWKVAQWHGRARFREV